MIVVLAVLGVIFLLLFVGFLIYLVYMGSCHSESTTADAADVASQPPSQLIATTKTAPLDLSAPKTITAADRLNKTLKESTTIDRQIMTAKTTEKVARKLDMPPQSPPKSSIPTPLRATNSPSGRARASKEPIVAIVNKSLTSVKSMSSNNTMETSSSKAISTRSSLEVQRKELALKKKKAKGNAATKTPEAK